MFPVLLALFLAQKPVGYPIDVIRDVPLREEATANSTTIININRDATVIVVNKIPYWFEVEVGAEESGEIKRGWVSKQSAKPHKHSAGRTSAE